MLHIIITFFFYYSEPYQDWAGSESEYSNIVMQFLASNDLMPVVLGVSLLIWFTLLAFIVRLDFKVARLEEEISNNTND